jgi:hypothetical protein
LQAACRRIPHVEEPLNTDDVLFSDFKALDAVISSQSLVAQMAEEKERYLSARLLQQDSDWLDELRRAETDIPSRGEMMRRLIRRAYAALGKDRE